MWTEERKQKQSEIMKSLWKEGKLRINRKRPRSTNIDISQTEDYSNYMREYQKIFRKKNKSYYRLRQLWNRKYKDKYTWKTFYGMFKDMPRAADVEARLDHVDLNLNFFNNWVPDYSVP